jgi:FG-GAP-like repeat/FG-GAP repeat
MVQAMLKIWGVRRISIRQMGAVMMLSVLLSGCGAGVPISSNPPTPPPTSGTLAFASPFNIATGGSNPASVAVADFNGDGKPDIAVANFDSNTISIFLNKGNGAFQNPIPVNVNISDNLGPIAVGDFNGDGKQDLLVATISGPQATIVMLGNGDGTFVQQAPIPGSFGFNQAAVVDLNGDGHLDIVEVGNAFVEVALGKGDGTFGPLTSLPAVGASGPVVQVVVKDFNGDGKLDIAAVEATDVSGGFFTSGNLLFFAGNGDGTFQSGTVTALTLGGLNSVVAADFNGDGKQDVALGGQNSSALALGNGDGTFGKLALVVEPIGNASGDGQALATADFDLDGKPDLVAIDHLSGIVTLLLNSAVGVFPAPSNSTFTFNLAAGINNLAVGDFNGDGLPDIVVCNPLTNQISIILSQKQ